jgi:hypothetical protein
LGSLYWGATDQTRSVSFDIFLQRFVDGEAVDADGDSMLAILNPLIAAARSAGRESSPPMGTQMCTASTTLRLG